MKAKTFKAIVFSVAAVLIAIVMAISIAISVPLLRGLLDKFVVGYKDGEGSSAARAGGRDLAEQIQGEGTVLVKNEGNLLPMSIDDAPKVNVFGWASTDWVVSGSGSGQVKCPGTVKLLGNDGALKTAGIDYNTELEKMYESYMSHRNMSENGGGVNGAAANAGALKSFNYEFSRLYEPDITEVKASGNNCYTQSLLDNALAYSDTAIVVIGRVSGESNDSPKVQYKNYLGGNGKPGDQYIDTERTYLEISTEEEDLLTYVGAHYENVIVLVNTTNVMELGFMDTIPGLDACLVVGTTGSVGAYAIPRILYSDLGEVDTGEVDKDGEPVMHDFSMITPSGKLADTYAYDLSTSSTYVDTGSGNDSTHFYTNAMNGSGLYPTTVQHTNGSKDEPYAGVAYQDYREGVYMGYKWYETADEMGFWKSDFAREHWGVNGYDEVVQYPFGYGLSYTTFSWETTTMVVKYADGTKANLTDGLVIPESELDTATIEINVNVKNTGKVAGKEVVELYYSAPYTKGGIEKSSVNLAAFGKTQVDVQPGETAAVVLSFKVSDMASYDYLETKVDGGGYVMEEGTYTLSLRTDAHTVSKKMESTSSATFTVKVNKDTQVGNASNKFTGENAVDGVAIDGNSDHGADITYLSRDNFAGTFPIEFGNNRAMSDKIKALNSYTSAMANEWDAAHDDGPTVTFGQNSGSYIVYEGGAINALGQKLGMDYDAPEWEAVLNSIPKSQMQSLVLHGYTQTMAVSAIGKPKTLDLDGPNQIGSFTGSYPDATGYSSIVLAQTWNAELAYSMGLAFGRECATYGVVGWYGPGVNVHRSPFGGRNYEYYSEDATLSGIMCANTVKAAKNMGVFCWLKHICLYEGESGRDSMYTWVTEQALREIYLKPFEIAVKEGGSSAMMTSYGRIGAVWTGGSYALLTDVVRGEWGFKGAFLTDYTDHKAYMNGDQMLRAGGDLWMDGYQNDGTFKCSTSSNAYDNALRQATKNIVYMWLNALATNADYNAKILSGEINDSVSTPGVPQLKFRWYIPVIVVVDVVFAAGAAVLIFFGIKKKDPVVEGGDEASDGGDKPTESSEEKSDE